MLLLPYPVDWGGAPPLAHKPPAAVACNKAVDAAAALVANVREQLGVLSPRRMGVCVALFSLVFSAPDATLLRCLQQDGTPNSVIIVWKTFVYTVLQAAFGVHQDGSVTRVLAKARSTWPWMLVGSLSLGVEWLATLANLTTSSASALALFYIAPLWAVPMGMIVNSDALHTRTLVAMAVALSGILLIFAPSVLSATHPHPALATAAASAATATRHSSSLAGDVCGLVSGLAFAAWITTCRHASLHRPETPLALCGAIGTLAVVLPAGVLAIRRGDDLLNVSPRFVVLVLLDCAAIAAYNIGTMIASKYLPSAELGLYLTLDVVFAPLLVWGVHGEVPTSAVVLGGSLLVSALLAHEMLALLSHVHATVVPLSPKHKMSESNLAALGGADEAALPLMYESAPTRAVRHSRATEEDT